MSNAATLNAPARRTPQSRCTMNVVLLGAGTVGGELAKILAGHPANPEAEQALDYEVIGALVRDTSTPRTKPMPLRSAR